MIDIKTQFYTFSFIPFYEKDYTFHVRSHPPAYLCMISLCEDSEVIRFPDDNEQFYTNDHIIEWKFENQRSADFNFAFHSCKITAIYVSNIQKFFL